MLLPSAIAAKSSAPFADAISPILGNGAGALVAPGKEIGERELWLGNPARKVRMLSDAEVDALFYSAQHYVRLKDQYLGMTA